MLSTVCELAGFAAIIAATYLLGGLIPALYTAGPVLLALGYATEDAQAVLALRRATAPARRVSAAVRQARRRRELAKAG